MPPLRTPSIVKPYTFHRLPLTLRQRIIPVIILLVVLVTTVSLQEFRKEHFRWWLGVAPSFLSAVGMPVYYGVIKLFPGGNRGQRMILLYGITLIFHVSYETLLWLDGRSFDWWDNVLAAVGALFGVLLYEIVYWRYLPVAAQDASEVKGEKSE